MKYKEDFEEAQHRWDAFWRGEILDRPCMLVTARRDKLTPPPEPATLRDKWMNVDYLLTVHEHRHRSTWYLGEAIPSMSLLFGWCAAYGAQVEFLPDTIWIKPCIKSWETAPDWETAWDDEGWRFLKKAYERIVDEIAGKYFLGMGLILPPNDLLAMLRGPETFQIDLIEHPDEVKRALAIMRRNYIHMQRELDDIRLRKLQGYGCHWMVWSREPMGLIQSDLSCMISGRMFDEFILPEIHTLAGAVTNCFYHLDGPGAIRHLEKICSVPNIKCIQWVPGAGQPSNAFYWLDLYKRIQGLGKAVFIGVSPNELETVIRELDPRKLILQMGARTKAEGEELLKKAAEWTWKYWAHKLRSAT